MNPNATITLNDPQTITWSATLVYPEDSFWMTEDAALAFDLQTGRRHEIDDTAARLSMRLGGAVAEGFQVIELNAYHGEILANSWALRYMHGGLAKGQWHLQLYGPGKGVAAFWTPIQALEAIVDTHTDGWRMDIATGEIFRIDG